MIIGATSTAMVVGLPLGRVIGLYVGWRVTFAVIGVLSTNRMRKHCHLWR